MKQLLPFLLLLTSCYSVPEIEGFDRSVWLSPIRHCEQTKTALAELLLKNDSLLLGEGQAEIKALLGRPYANELYHRNQKFLYYNLTAGDSCANVEKALQLSIHFDALDRVKELRIIEN